VKAGPPAVPEEFAVPLPRHHYAPGIMQLMVQGMLVAAAGQRSIAAVVRLVARWLPGVDDVPCANTGRMWLLRLGLYELQRKKPAAEDWVYIFDHTVQMGPLKVLIIVGIRLSTWEARGRGPLEHKDLTVLDVTPMERSSGDAVEARLRAVAATTGVPRQIVSDGGTDLAKGIKQYQKEYPAVSRVYDIKHKMALLLKARLDGDPRWTKFLNAVNQARARVTLTGLAALAPPNLKVKARYMNLPPLIRWGLATLRILDDRPKQLPLAADPETLREKLGWLSQYREALYHWSVLLEIADIADRYVRAEGYHAGAAAALEEQLSGLAINACAHTMQTEVIQFVSRQSAQARPEEHLIGSSEVLESLIGRYKRLQGTQSAGGVTPLVLAVGAMVLDLTTSILGQALSAIRVRDVLTWCREHLGLTLQAQRSHLYREQKQETNPRPRLRGI
jgi:hypothetical protein